MSVKAILIQLPEELYKKIKIKAIQEDLSFKYIYIELSKYYVENKINIKENKNDRESLK